MTMPMQFNREKLDAAILHICNKCPPAKLGAVKLHKVLYFSDMIGYAQSGVAITGATYRKRPYGPTCVQLLPALRELEQAGKLTTREVEYFGLRKKEYVARARTPDGILSANEIELLDEVIEFVCEQNTAKTISDYSHQAPWERAEFGEEIPYSTAYLLFPSMVSQEAFEVTARGLDEVGRDAEQGTKSVVFTDYRVFRQSLREKGVGIPL